MDTSKTIARSFSGGEISPDMLGRPDVQRYGTALAFCQNFVPTPQGVLYRRRGTEVVASAKDSQAVLLQAFSFNDDQAYIAEFGNLYVRLYWRGAQIVSNGTPAELATPYLIEDLPGLRFAQSGDVLTITHRRHPVYEFVRVSGDQFTLSVRTFEPRGRVPTSITAEAVITVTANLVLTDHFYKATTIDPESGEESLLSPTYWLLRTDLTKQGNYNKVFVHLDGATGLVRARVYKRINGLMGFIGELEFDAQNPTASFFTDDNITPDLGSPPPEYASRFDRPYAYPASVSYLSQRKVFAGSDDQPTNVWMSRAGTENNFTFSVPGKATDALTYTLAATAVNRVKHMVDFDDLFLLTSGGIWRSSSTDAGVIAQDTIEFKGMAYAGCGEAAPIKTDSTILYAAHRGQHIMELDPKGEKGRNLRDLNLLAPHLIDGFSIVKAAFVRAPSSVALFLRSDGLLIGLNYLPSEEVQGWFRIKTLGPIVSFDVIPEDGRDGVYLAVRHPNGIIMIERFEFGADPIKPNDTPYLDSTHYYNGGPTTTLSNLWLFAGRQAIALLDNDDEPVVISVNTSGQAVLPRSASKAQVGGFSQAIARTLPFVFDVAADGAVSNVKNVHRVTLDLFRTKGISVTSGAEMPQVWADGSVNFEDEDEVFDSTWTQSGAKVWGDRPIGDPYPQATTGLREMLIDGQWKSRGAVTIISDKPQPARIRSLIAEVSIGV